VLVVPPALVIPPVSFAPPEPVAPPPPDAPPVPEGDLVLLATQAKSKHDAKAKGRRPPVVIIQPPRVGLR
jgi:hypothetical protein